MKEKLKPHPIEEVFFVINPEGKIWSEYARASHNECRSAFVKDYLSIVANHVDHHTCWAVWQCFEKAGFKIHSVRTDFASTTPTPSTP